MDLGKRKLRLIEDTKTGNCSYTITIPKRFCNDNDLDAGDYLYFEKIVRENKTVLLIKLKKD